MLLGNRVLLIDQYVTSTALVWAWVWVSQSHLATNCWANLCQLQCHWEKIWCSRDVKAMLQQFWVVKIKTTTWLLLKTTVTKCYQWLFNLLLVPTCSWETGSASTTNIETLVCQKLLSRGYTTKRLKEFKIFSLTLSWRVTWRVFSKISHSSLFVRSLRSVEAGDKSRKLDI